MTTHKDSNSKSQHLRWSIVGCKHCDTLWIVESLRDEETAECPQCLTTHQSSQLRAKEQHDDWHAACELRSRLLAVRAGEIESYQEKDDYATLDDRADEYLNNLGYDSDYENDAEDVLGNVGSSEVFDDWDLIEDDVEAEADRVLGNVGASEIAGGWNPNELEAAADRVAGKVVDDGDRMDRHYGADRDPVTLKTDSPVHNEISTSSSPTGTGSLDIVLESDDVQAHAEINEPQLTSTDLWSDICRTLVDQVGLAIETIAADLDVQHRDEIPRIVDHLRDAGVNDGLIFFVCDYLKNSSRSELSTTIEDSWSQLGRGGVGIESDGGGLEDVSEVLRLFDVAGLSPSLKLGLPLAWADADDTQRRRWLGFVSELSASLSITIQTSRAEVNRIVDNYSNLIPASTVNEARQTTHPSQSPAARTAEQALDDLGEDNVHWKVIDIIGQQPREMPSMATLRSHTLLSDVDPSTHTHRIDRLEDLDLVERVELDGKLHVRLLPAGAYALSEFSVGGTASKQDFSDDEDAVEASGVNNLLNPDPITVYPRQGREDPPASSPADSPADRPAEEFRSTVEESTTRPSQETTWMDHNDHYAVSAATQEADFALVDEPVDRRDHAANTEISNPTVRDNEIVVSVQPSPFSTARSAVRLATSLADNRLIVPILNKIDEDGDLSGLVESDPVVLRLARQIGYLSKTDESGAGLVNSTKAAREALIDDLPYLKQGDDFDGELGSKLQKDAMGLAGSLVHLYEMAGYDVSVLLDFPDLDSWKETASTMEWIATQTAICSRYGHYPLYRCQIEKRDEKRQAMLGKPDVDLHNPKGDLCINWCLRGSGVSDLKEDLCNLWSFLEQVDESFRNFVEFEVDYSVGSPGREEIAGCLTQICVPKRIETTRKTVSTVHSLTDSIFDAAEAIHQLGGQDQHRGRDLHLKDVRKALTYLSPSQILPQLDNGSTGEICHALLCREGTMTTSELVEATGRCRQTIGNKIEMLQTLGFVDVINMGPGKAKRYVFKLHWARDGSDVEELSQYRDCFVANWDDTAWQPDDFEIVLEPQPLHCYQYGDPDVSDTLGELLMRIGYHPEDDRVSPDDSHDAQSAMVDQQNVYAVCDIVGNWITPWIEIMTRYLSDDLDRVPSRPAPVQGSLGSRPEVGQISLDQATDRLAVTDGGDPV